MDSLEKERARLAGQARPEQTRMEYGDEPAEDDDFGRSRQPSRLVLLLDALLTVLLIPAVVAIVWWLLANGGSFAPTCGIAATGPNC